MRIMDKKMEALQDLLIRMNASVEATMDTAVKAFLEGNIQLAHDSIELDKKTDQLEMKIENMCINIMATQQPVGIDIRKLASVLKLVTDLERIGDYSVDISEMVLETGAVPTSAPLAEIEKMAVVAKQMIRLSIDSFLEMDAEKAKGAAMMDDEVDDLYLKAYSELLTILIEDRAKMKEVTHLLFAGRYLERIADHATNICERVIYMVTGDREHY